MVVFLQRIVLGLFLHYALLLAQCPPLGSVLPAPTGLSQSPVLQELVTQINVQLQNTSSTLNQTAVSIGVRSLHDSGPLMNFHHTPSKFNTTGVHKVDGNTVYRIGSTSKLFTALSILQLEGNGKVNLSDSVTKYVPGLGVLSGPNNSLTKVDWNSVTIEALLSHMGGVPADLSNSAIQYVPGLTQEIGLPQLPQAQQSLPCGDAPGEPGCTWDVFLENIGRRPPVYRPFTTPVYSNVGYAVLGRVIENVSGKTYAEYLEQNIISKARMNRTTIGSPPTSNLGFIPAESNWWSTSIGFENPSGGIYASNNDLLSFGAAILSNTLGLDSERTRTWMKPVTFTSSMGIAVGAPWEIARGTTNVTSDASSGRVIDFYTKTGNLGDYTAILVLVPDYDLVIGMNLAGPDSSIGAIQGIFSALVQAIVPVVDRIGKSQASQQFSGTYTTTSTSTGGAKPNSTTSTSSHLTLSVDDKFGGLLVSNFTANGVDVAAGFSALNGYDAADSEGRTMIRLYPTNLKAGNESAWRAVYTVGTAEEAASFDAQLFFPKGSCQTWTEIDLTTYGLEALDYFVLTEDESGKIVAVEPKAWRLVLQRVN